jgi:hypothetical protein
MSPRASSLLMASSSNQTWRHIKYIHDLSRALTSVEVGSNTWRIIEDGHPVRVARYSYWIARDLGQSEEQIKRLSLKAMLHDAGKAHPKIASIRSSHQHRFPRTLSDAYTAAHTKLGPEVLRAINLPNLLEDFNLGYSEIDFVGLNEACLYHHTSEPELANDGRNIDVSIIKVADCYDVMTCEDRAYKCPDEIKTPIQAADELRACSEDNGQFSRRIAEEFITGYIELRRAS